MRRFALAAALLGLCSSSWARSDDGLPVDHDLVRAACGACHAADDDGRMTRISYQRKTPEGWQITVKRMIRTRGLDLSPDQARDIVRYLSDHHGLAPEEARPYFYRAEKRPTIESFEDEQLQATCVRCHLGARFMTQRRSAEEWDLLKGMHIGYFPVIESQTFRGPSALNDGGVFSGEEEETTEWRADRVLAKLAAELPFDTPEWNAFQAKGSARGLSGRWLFSAHEMAKGPAVGIATFEGADGDYTYTVDVLHADGTTDTREGRGVLYTGYSWRGSSSGGSLGELREVMMLSADGSKLEGRMYHGEYGELGMDVSMRRLGSDPALSAVWPRSARVGAGRIQLTVMGANLGDDLQFGQGVTVVSVDGTTETSVRLTVEVADDALPGARDVYSGPSQLVDGFAVYDRVDYVRVLPEESLARVGGAAVAKQFAQFEAVAYHRGADDEILTDDDVRLGVVQPEWELEEYHIRHGDDDVDFVGTIDSEGLFTPAVDGPNPERELNANNFGDVWVVASFSPEGQDETLRGRSRLVVAPPIFVYWNLTP